MHRKVYTFYDKTAGRFFGELLAEVRTIRYQYPPAEIAGPNPITPTISFPFKLLVKQICHVVHVKVDIGCS